MHSNGGSLMLVFKIVLDFLACCGYGYWGWTAVRPYVGVGGALALFRCCCC